MEDSTAHTADLTTFGSIATCIREIVRRRHFKMGKIDINQKIKNFCDFMLILLPDSTNPAKCSFNMELLRNAPGFMVNDFLIKNFREGDPTDEHIFNQVKEQFALGDLDQVYETKLFRFISCFKAIARHL